LITSRGKAAQNLLSKEQEKNNVNIKIALVIGILFLIYVNEISFYRKEVLSQPYSRGLMQAGKNFKE
jgi:hypothetical protein